MAKTMTAPKRRNSAFAPCVSASMKTCGRFSLEVVQFAAFVRMRNYRKQKWCRLGATVVPNGPNHGMPHRNGTTAMQCRSVGDRMLDRSPNALEDPRAAEVQDRFAH